MNGLLFAAFAIVFVYSLVSHPSHSWAVGFFMLLNLWAVVSSVKHLKKINSKSREETKKKTALLNPLLTRGMDEDSALSAVVKKFGKLRPPRYYSEGPSTQWVEVDTSEATFMIYVKNGKVKQWSAK